MAGNIVSDRDTMLLKTIYNLTILFSRAGVAYFNCIKAVGQRNSSMVFFLAGENLKLVRNVMRLTLVPNEFYDFVVMFQNL